MAAAMPPTISPPKLSATTVIRRSNPACISANLTLISANCRSFSVRKSPKRRS